MQKKPILRGFAKDGLINVFCPYCDSFHHHGWTDGENKPTHRVAHCHSETGFRQSGYWIAPYRKKDLDFMKAGK
jgi:hypothetical protein